MTNATTLEPIPPLRYPPSVDVVIPVRNRARFIGACLDSVRVQTFQPAAVVVVDDGSTDDTMAILAAYARDWPELRVIRTAPRGVSAARNTALAASTAQLVAFIDSDDVWPPEKLARQVALFTPDRPQLSLVHCGLRQIDEHGNPLRGAPVKVPSKRGDVFRDMLEGFYGIAPSTIVARRDLVLSVGGFDEALVQAEDRDLCLKLARVWQVDYVPDVLIGLRSHGGNSYAQAMKNDPELVLFQRLKVWNKWFDDIEDLDAVLRTFRAEALSTSISIMLQPKPNFGLYRRLARSEMRIATRLFSDTGDYVRGLLCFIAPKLLPAKRIKLAVATRVILPNKRLLRLAQKFGRFRNVDTHLPPHHSAAFAGMAKLRKPRYRPEAGRVLMVTADLVRGGSERQMLVTASGLLGRGYSVRMLAIARLEPGVPSFEAEMMRLGITPEFASDAEVDRPNLRAPRDTFCSVDYAALPKWLVERVMSVAAAIERHRPAVVHCWLDGPGVFGALAGCSLGAPRILIRLGSTAAIVRRNVERAELLRQAYRALVRNPTVTILNSSKAGARDYEEWLGLPPGKIAVLHSGFIPNSARTPDPEETARFRVSLGLSAAAVVVGTVMRFVPEKDPNLWLDTAAEIARSRPDVRFLIGGFGVLEQEMIRRIEGLGLGGRVVLAGPVTDPGLAYSAMDVVLLTSAVEGLPNVMIEAQAVGRPVVATDVGGTREALVEGRTGVIVRSRSAANLAKAVITMLDDVHWRERVRTEGPEFVASRFGLGRMVSETIGHYGFVAGS